MNSKRSISIILALVMVLGTVFSGGTVYAQFDDMPNNWAKPGLEHAIKYNLLQGHDNKVKPNDNLTRAELATVVSRMLGLKEQADLSEYKDVSEKAWYYIDLARTVKAGIFKGSNGKLNPTSNITREETFVVMARVFALDSDNTNILGSFNDKGNISGWANGGIAGLFENGYIKGDNKHNLNPKEPITRAEYATLLNSLTEDFIQESGLVEGKKINGNLIVNTKDVNLKNVTIDGDLILAEGIELSKIDLSNTKVTGRILVRGGKGLNLHGSNVDKIRVLDRVSAFETSVDEKSEVKSIETDVKLNLTGKGKVGQAIFNEGSKDSKVETPDTKIKLNGVDSIKDKDGKEIKENTTINKLPGKDKPGTGTGGGIIGGGGGSTETPEEPKPIVVDKSKLKLTVTEANDKKSIPEISENGEDIDTITNWVTQDAMNKLEKAIEEANEVVENEKATQGEVDKALANLRKAIDEFIPAKGTKKIDKAYLEELIAKAEGTKVAISTEEDAKELSQDKKWVTEEENTKLDEAIEAAQSIVDKVDATDEEMEEEVIAIKNAMKEYEAAKKLGTKEYEAAKVLVDALFKGEELVEGVDETKIAEARTAVEGLKDETKKKELTERINKAEELLKAKIEEKKAELTNKIQEANANKEDVEISENGEDIDTITNWVTQDAMDKLEKAIEEANKVVENEKATQGEVDKALANLRKAIDEFKPAKGTKKIDKAYLEELIAKAEGIEVDSSTEEEAKKLSQDVKWVTEEENTKLDEAIKSIEDVAGKEDATAEEMEEAVIAIKNAMKEYEAAKKLGTKEYEAAKVLVDALFKGEELAEGVDETKIAEARTAVEELKDETKKKELTDRITKAEGLMEAKIEEEKYEAAKKLVDALFKADSEDKELAEGVGQEQIDAAKGEVEGLKDGDKKKELTERVDKAEELLKAKIEEEEKYEAAKKLVDALFKADSEDKELAEGVDETKIDEARTAVEGLKDGDKKTALTERVDNAKKLLDSKIEEEEKYEAAKVLVDALFEDEKDEKLAEGVGKEQIDAAKGEVEGLKDGDNKIALEERIVKAEELLKAKIAEKKEELKKKIEEANRKKEDVEVSEDGTDIDTITNWVKQDAMNKLEKAIEEANEVVENEKATQGEVDKALANLRKAIDEFIPKPGTKEEVDKTDLQKTIDEANKVLGKMTTDRKKALDEAIKKAQETKDKKGVTAEEIEDAKKRIKGSYAKKEIPYSS